MSRACMEVSSGGGWVLDEPLVPGPPKPEKGPEPLGVDPLRLGYIPGG